MKELLEFYISSLLSNFANEEGVAIKDIKIKTERSDSIFNGGPSYLVEITYK